MNTIDNITIGKEHSQLRVKAMVGANLRVARKNMTSYSVNDVAELLVGDRTKHSTITNIEAGKRNLKMHELLEFTDLYGVSLDFIFGVTVEPEQGTQINTINYTLHRSKYYIDLAVTQVSNAIYASLPKQNERLEFLYIECQKMVDQKTKLGFNESYKNVSSVLLEIAKQRISDEVRTKALFDTDKNMLDGQVLLRNKQPIINITE